MLKDALLYKKLADNKVSCFLCSHHCLISAGKFGICNVRERLGYSVKEYKIKEGRCLYCREPTNGVGL